MQYNAIQVTMQYSTSNAIQYNALQCNAIQYVTVQYNTIQYVAYNSVHLEIPWQS